VFSLIYFFLGFCFNKFNFLLFAFDLESSLC
jgi:hypothetical protein